MKKLILLIILFINSQLIGQEAFVEQFASKIPANQTPAQALAYADNLLIQAYNLDSKPVLQAALIAHAFSIIYDVRNNVQMNGSFIRKFQTGLPDSIYAMLDSLGEFKDLVRQHDQAITSINGEIRVLKGRISEVEAIVDTVDKINTNLNILIENLDGFIWSKENLEPDNLYCMIYWSLEDWYEMYPAYMAGNTKKEFNLIKQTTEGYHGWDVIDFIEEISSWKDYFSQKGVDKINEIMVLE